MRRALMITAAALLPLAAQAAPPTLSGASAHGEMVLRSMDAPLTPRLIAQAGITEAHAQRLLTAAEAGPYDRIRAVVALGFFDTDTAYQAVLAQARGAEAPQLRIQAIITLARAASLHRPQQVRADLAALASADLPAKIQATLAAERVRLDPPAAADPTTGR